MKKLVRQYLNEDIHFDDNDEYDEMEEGGEIENDPFIRADGWNKNTLREVNLLDWLDEVERVQYEVKNARRGSYGIDGDTGEDLLGKLKELHTYLDDVINSVEDMIENNK